MGVPAFFRWLSRKYPSIVVHCKEDKSKVIDGVQVPVDLTQPNPNNIEFDNLYLDMNGIIHPCCHPENKPAPKNEDEMMVLIFEYIDRLMAIVRPRKLLYMAIDGVAPRAKMNQQRSRRFRASKESRENRQEIARVKEEMREKGLEVPADKPASEHFDSNCITPGTPFMSRLADCLRYYIHSRLNNDPGWAQLMVILSDANSPGEGEHKIMDFIRRQRAQPDHDPNTHHCLCGADADLIMLGLATHEPNFTIIREEFKPNAERPCEICGGSGHQMKECMGLAKVKSGEFDEAPKFVGSDPDFIFIRLNILREYLYKELRMVNLPFKEDLERAIDDWVLMCFFVGNDFLPHLPSLEIREGAIDRLITLYKKVVYKTGGYLTDSGIVRLDRVQLMLTDLGEVEDAIFKKRRESDLEYKRRNQEKTKRQRLSEYDAPKWIPQNDMAPVQLGYNLVPQASTSQSIREHRQRSFQSSRNSQQEESANQLAAYNLKQNLNSSTSESTDESRKRKWADSNDEEPEPVDDVRLWEDGWKERYYINKFGVDTDDIDFRTKVANEYVLGMCWVLKYYYQGCASWDWYFPYHYAPFASDFQDIGNLDTSLPDNTEPFKPLEQLMSVFPAASKQFLPFTWQSLMYKPDSPIIDFYPEDFKVDLNGKKYAWQGVALLPFVDERRLLKVLNTVYPDLSDDEKYRNTRGSDRLFVHKFHMAFDCLDAIYKETLDNERKDLNPSVTNGVAGLIWGDDKVHLSGEVVPSPLPQMEDLVANQAISVKYQDPQYSKGYIFLSKLLPKAKIPPAVLKPEDFNQRYPGQRFRAQTGFTKDSGFSSYNDTNVLARHIRANLSTPNLYNDNSSSSGYNSSSSYDSNSNYNPPRPHMSYPPPGSYDSRNGSNNFDRRRSYPNNDYYQRPQWPHSHGSNNDVYNQSRFPNQARGWPLPPPSHQSPQSSPRFREPFLNHPRFRKDY